MGGLPAGCSSQEGAEVAAAGDEPARHLGGDDEESLAAAGGALWSDRGDTDEASPAASSGLADDLTEKERRFLERLPHLAAIQARFEPKLFAHQGVNSIGVGLMDDDITPVFRVAVTNPELRGVLPSVVEGVAVDIRVAEPVRLLHGGPGCNGAAGPPECHAEQLPLPVEMGNSGAWFLGSACTMGFKACDLTTGNSVLVTNSHCADYPNGCALAAIGDPFKHTSPQDSDGSNVTIGTIAGHAAPSCSTMLNNYTDATKVTSAFFQSSRDHRDIGSPKNVVGNPMPGWPVQYSGRTTGHNRGEIVAVNVTVFVPAVGGFCCGALLMHDQVSFTPEYPVQGGDSGSGVLFDWGLLRPRFDNRIAGLLFGADNTYAYFNNINRVMSALDLTLDFTECGFPPED